MKKYFIIFNLLLSITMLYGQAPQLVNYQGKLDSAGVPLNGTRNLTFNIYDVLTGGTAIWTETQTGATITNGVFNVILGSVSAFSTATSPLFVGTGDRYIGITVGSGTEMTPRLRITSVAFSLRAAQADGVADNAITSAKILNGTVTTADIADGTVATADLADNSVTSAKIVDGTIAAADLAANSVTTVKIADNAVTSAKILDGTIIGTDINSNAALTVQSITYSAAKTGYISGTSWALGRSLYSTGSFTYSAGLYNNGTGTAFYEVPVQLPDGVTLTEVIVYGYDADATLQLSFNASRQTLASSSGSVLGSASSGNSFASGHCQLVATLSATIDNSLYSYYLELSMPNTINVRYFSFRAKFTYTTPGSLSKDGQPQFETSTKQTEDPQKLQGSVIVE